MTKARQTQIAPPEVRVKPFVGRCYHCHWWSSSRRIWGKDRFGKCLKTTREQRATAYCDCGKYAGAYGNSPSPNKV